VVNFHYLNLSSNTVGTEENLNTENARQRCELLAR
ncbi:unnamed protein product, partial [Rotaria sp. Silwood2]